MKSASQKNGCLLASFILPTSGCNHGNRSKSIKIKEVPVLWIVYDQRNYTGESYQNIYLFLFFILACDVSIWYKHFTATNKKKSVQMKSLDESQIICLPLTQEKSDDESAWTFKQVALLWARTSHLFVLNSFCPRSPRSKEGKHLHYMSCALSLQSCWKDASNGDHPRQQFVELLQTEAMKIIRHASVLIVKDGDFRVSRA